MLGIRYRVVKDSVWFWGFKVDLVIIKIEIC